MIPRAALRGLKTEAERSEGLTRYQFDPIGYIETKLGWSPWAGEDGEPGQVEIIDAVLLAVRQQLERDAYQKGNLSEEELVHWKPRQVIKNWIVVPSGHTTGKTKVASGIVNWFFDCFVPSIIYTFAPTWPQVRDLLWKEIKRDRAGKRLPGRILGGSGSSEVRLERSANHFATGRATNDANATGTERAQGQHGRFLLFVIDEGEGVPKFIYDAVESMTGGGIVIVLVLGNPKTRTSTFFKVRERADAVTFRLSCLNHPNVIHDREIVPEAVMRRYVEGMLENHTKVVAEHNEDEHTFELPWRLGVIYRPDAEFCFRVLGIAPANLADNILVPPGRFDAAKKRDATIEEPAKARIGIDMARWGSDYGTAYVRHVSEVWRFAQFMKQDSYEYLAAVKGEAKRLAAIGVTDLEVRVDGTGGFGSGIIDLLKADLELGKLFARFVVHEVNFGADPYDKTAYADIITEAYAEAAESLKGLRIVNPPETLEMDLCDRSYDWKNRSGREVKKLEPKAGFRKRHKRSPDDGDGFVLAAAPDFMFRSEDLPATAEAESVSRDDIEEMLS